MTTTVALLVAATGLMFGSFAANEAAHGGLSEVMGLGHNHMFDYGGYHCAGPDDGEMWQEHQTHMHAGNGTMPADHCGSDHMRDAMHGQMGGGPMGGA